MSNEYKDWLIDFNRDLRGAIESILKGYGTFDEDQSLPDEFILTVRNDESPEISEIEKNPQSF